MNKTQTGPPGCREWAQTVSHPPKQCSQWCVLQCFLALVPVLWGCGVVVGGCPFPLFFFFLIRQIFARTHLFNPQSNSLKCEKAKVFIEKSFGGQIMPVGISWLRTQWTQERTADAERTDRQSRIKRSLQHISTSILLLLALLWSFSFLFLISLRYRIVFHPKSS